MSNIVTTRVLNFDKELQRIENEIKEIAAQDSHQMIDKATQELRIVTPIDTGEARSGWVNTKQRDLLGNKVGTISNPVDHIAALNDGHSKQAPRFFIEQVLSKIGIITPE
jgi:hypothetical protein